MITRKISHWTHCLQPPTIRFTPIFGVRHASQPPRLDSSLQCTVCRPCVGRFSGRADLPVQTRQHDRGLSPGRGLRCAGPRCQQRHGRGVWPADHRGKRGGRGWLPGGAQGRPCPAGWLHTFGWLPAGTHLHAAGCGRGQKQAGGHAPGRPGGIYPPVHCRAQGFAGEHAGGARRTGQKV